MTRTRANAGFSLVEMATAVGIVSILAALSFAALEVLPQRTRLTGGALEFAAVLSSARSHAYGRNERVVVLINADGPTAGQPIKYWVVVDRWSNLDEKLAATPAWKSLADLPPASPAPAGSHYPLLDSGHFNPSVRVLPGGYQASVGSVVHRACTALLATKIGLAEGPSSGSDTFPPPFCFVPNNAPCTFCSGAGTAANPLRGVVYFEPDGTVVLANAEGVPATVGSGSITFLPTGGGGIETAQAVVITNTGLVRTFSANSHLR
jgi:prepilin-type N-terminal cleavage/methylation domain-containing protein